MGRLRNKNSFTFAFDEELRAKYQRLAKASRRSLASVITIALENYLKDWPALRSADGALATARRMDGVERVSDPSEIDPLRADIARMAAAPHGAAIDAVGDSFMDMDSLDLDRDKRTASPPALDIDLPLAISSSPPGAPSGEVGASPDGTICSPMQPNLQPDAALTLVYP